MHMEEVIGGAGPPSRYGRRPTFLPASNDLSVRSFAGRLQLFGNHIFPISGTLPCRSTAMTPVRLQDLPSLRPPSPYLAAEIAAQVRQPVGVLHSDALVPKEWSVCMVRERWFIHAPRGAGHQLENEHLRLQVLPPIGTSSGRGRVHNRPQARRRWTWE